MNISNQSFEDHIAVKAKWSFNSFVTNKKFINCIGVEDSTKDDNKLYVYLFRDFKIIDDIFYPTLKFNF